MKILQIFGAVVAVHLLAFIFIFASPGCQSGPRTVPTPDATVPTASAPNGAFDANATAPQPVDLGTPAAYSASGYSAPTRPGSPAAAAISPSRVADDVAPASTYTVGKGDSLYTIAKKNHLTVSELAKANKLGTGAILKPGKKLIIPGKIVAPPKELPAATPAAATANAATDKTAAAPAHGNAEAIKHTVQPGESLGIIARKYQVSTGELAAANNITDPSKVRAGQQLVIPGFKAVGAKTAAPAIKTSAGTAAKPTAGTTATTKSAPGTAAAPAASAAPHFEIAAPPPGQDLDAGLKDASTEVPTIKVEDAKAEQTPKK